eukprot:3781409-Rhodomonas_salina.1
MLETAQSLNTAAEAFGLGQETGAISDSCCNREHVREEEGAFSFSFSCIRSNPSAVLAAPIRARRSKPLRAAKQLRMGRTAARILTAESSVARSECVWHGRLKHQQESTVSRGLRMRTVQPQCMCHSMR